MTTNQTSPALTVTPEADPKPRGILLPCPCCGEEEVEVTVNLSDLESLNCTSCGTDFLVEHVREFIARWSKLLKGLDALAAALAE